MDGVDLSKPIIEVLGTEDDPCFGKHLVTDSACKRCGDSELCAVITAQKQAVERKKLSKENTYRDEEEEVILKERDKKINKTIRVAKKMGNSDKKIRRKLKKRYDLSKAEVNKFIKQWKQKK